MKRSAYSLLVTAAMLIVATPALGQSYASALAVGNDEIFVGEPTPSTPGAVYVYRRGADGNWMESAKLVIDGEMGDRFGRALAVGDEELWVGAPRAGGFEGRLYRLMRDEASGEWTGAAMSAGEGVARGDRFANVFALQGSLAVVGLPGDDYGAGTAIVYGHDEASGDWNERGKIFSEAAGFEAVLGEQVTCEDGAAHLFDCGEVDLVSFLPVSAIGGARGVRVNDLWGWTDPETGREYGDRVLPQRWLYAPGVAHRRSSLLLHGR